MLACSLRARPHNRRGLSVAFDLPASKGPIRDLATEAGHTLGFALQAIGATVVATLRGRLSLGETLGQVVFIGRVSTGWGVGIDAFGSPMAADMGNPPFNTISGFTPKKAGFHNTRSASLPTSIDPTS